VTDSNLFAVLQCPVDGAALTFTEARDQPFGDGGFGVLTGGARPYPVIDGIPVLMDGEVHVLGHVSAKLEAPGPHVEELLAMLDEGRSLDALIALLTMPPSPQLRGRQVRGWRRLMAIDPVRRSAVASRRLLLRRKLAGGRRRGDLEWWLDLFHERSLGMSQEIGHYFRLRTTQPRYLAFRQVVPYILAGDRAHPVTVVDLACGSGHVSRDLLLNDGDIRVVGLDRTFYEVWLAKHWVAPAADFICADAAGGLPLADDSVGSVVCSDAFHYLPRPEDVVHELLRCCPTGPITVTRVANAQYEPHEGLERDPDGWRDLFRGRECDVLSEKELLAKYLAKEPLKLSDEVSPDAAADKWLTAVTWHPDRSMPTPDAAPDYPHARGRLTINPVYRTTATPAGVEGQLEFPSQWYEFENGAMREYHAPVFTMTQAELADLRAGRRTARTEELVDSFVLISAVSDAKPTG
jgi:SAM-dependent methyltransferase/uncharacterized protein YbaR (Trm112 family)